VNEAEHGGAWHLVAMTYINGVPTFTDRTSRNSYLWVRQPSGGGGGGGNNNGGGGSSGGGNRPGGGGNQPGGGNGNDGSPGNGDGSDGDDGSGNDTGGNGNEPTPSPTPRPPAIHGIEFEQAFADDLSGLIPPVINNVDVEVLDFIRGIYRITMRVEYCTLDPRATAPFFFGRQWRERLPTLSTTARITLFSRFPPTPERITVMYTYFSELVTA